MVCRQNAPNLGGYGGMGCVGGCMWHGRPRPGPGIWQAGTAGPRPWQQVAGVGAGSGTWGGAGVPTMAHQPT